MYRLLFAALLFLTACATEPRLQGRVLDIWDNPVAGATVVMDSMLERPLTDKNGKFNVPLLPGKHKLKAGREGYVPEQLEVDVAAGATEAESVLFRLYKKPDRAGFYVVGVDDYLPLGPQQVVQKGGDVEFVRGIERLGDKYIDGNHLKVLFHTPLTADQVHRLGLRLHRLAYVDAMNMTTSIEMERVPVRIYVADREVPIDIQPLRSRNDYLIETKEPVEAGEYALDHQGLMKDRSQAAFQEIPEPVRKAYPITVR